MKATQLAKQLLAHVDMYGDFDVIAAEDQEGNGFNDVRGLDVVVRIKNAGRDDGVYDTFDEAIDDGYEEDELDQKFLVFV